MNRHCSIFGFFLLTVGCHTPVDAGQACGKELEALPVTESAQIDVERIVEGLVIKAGAENYWDSIDPIDTFCLAPERLPDLMLAPVGVERTQAMAVKPVQRISVPGRMGVVFVYQSVGREETTTGLAATFVEYGNEGAPIRSYKVSELLSDEGWAKLTFSTLGETTITRCTQELEYFIYLDNGDIAGELETPTRTPLSCESAALF